jgi:hypothetical protein
MGANSRWPKSSVVRSNCMVLTIMRGRNVMRSKALRSLPAISAKAAALRLRCAMASNSNVLTSSRAGAMRPGGSPINVCALLIGTPF